MQEQQISFPLTNTEFLNVISNSFNAFIQSGTSRSTGKLKPLHGAIARDIADVLGDNYTVLSQGYEADREGIIEGRYFNKRVDITIQKDGCPMGGVAVKFIMQNYLQNSNNYFENMLGETANIRTGGCPYFQIFIILDKLPYYKRDKSISGWETFTTHNAKKYEVLSKDKADLFFHTPNKTLIYVVHVPDNEEILNLDDYIQYYKESHFQMALTKIEYNNFGDAVILNDYEKFREKLYHTLLAL